MIAPVFLYLLLSTLLIWNKILEFDLFTYIFSAVSSAAQIKDYSFLYVQQIQQPIRNSKTMNPEQNWCGS